MKRFFRSKVNRANCEGSSDRICFAAVFQLIVWLKRIAIAEVERNVIWELLMLMCVVVISNSFTKMRKFWNLGEISSTTTIVLYFNRINVAYVPHQQSTHTAEHNTAYLLANANAGITLGKCVKCHAAVDLRAQSIDMGTLYVVVTVIFIWFSLVVAVVVAVFCFFAFLLRLFHLDFLMDSFTICLLVMLRRITNSNHIRCSWYRFCKRGSYSNVFFA